MSPATTTATIAPDQEASEAVSITWTFEPVGGTMMTRPGVYCLPSNVLDWDVDTLVEELYHSD